jgi:hypothetical protein
MPNDTPKTAQNSVLTDDLLTPDFSKIPQVGSNVYDLDYFSGNSAVLYIGDVFIDEAVSFSFNVQQSKTPIYGYASQLFDDVSKGQVLVQGQFSVNFKEAGYLWLVLQRYKRFENHVDQTIAKYTQFADATQDGSGNVAQLAKKQLGGAGKILLGGRNNPFARIKQNGKEADFISRAGIERLVSGAATTDERYNFYQNLAGYATISQGKAAKDKAFEDIVEVFEDQVWQDNVSDLDDMTRRVDDNFFDDFDMFLVYGDYTKPGANHTVRRIRGVHLLSTGQQVQVGGEPILETYNFFARNII